MIVTKQNINNITNNILTNIQLVQLKLIVENIIGYIVEIDDDNMIAVSNIDETIIYINTSIYSEKDNLLELLLQDIKDFINIKMLYDKDIKTYKDLKTQFDYILMIYMKDNEYLINADELGLF